MDATHNMSAGDIKLSWKPPSNVSARNKIEFYRVKFRKEGPLHHLQYLVPHVNYTDVPGVRKCWRCTFTWLRIGLRGSCFNDTDTKKNADCIFTFIFLESNLGYYQTTTLVQWLSFFNHRNISWWSKQGRRLCTDI